MSKKAKKRAAADKRRQREAERQRAKVYPVLEIRDENGAWHIWKIAHTQEQAEAAIEIRLTAYGQFFEVPQDHRRFRWEGGCCLHIDRVRITSMALEDALLRGWGVPPNRFGPRASPFL